MTNVVSIGAAAYTPTHRTVRLLRLDGTEFASAGFPNGPGLASAPWSWICETVSRELDVSEDAVHVLEGEDGTDFITVDGLPVYRVAIGARSSFQN
jgi:hypothetical protein